MDCISSQLVAFFFFEKLIGKVLEGESFNDKNTGFKIIYSGHDKRVNFKGG
jgi:hypothetical protein